MSTASTIKEKARRIVEQLPDDASWEDLIYRIYVRQAVEAGLKDADEGRTRSLEEVRRKFGLGLKRHAGAQ
jgi:predicted transcriptional regulator